MYKRPKRGHEASNNPFQAKASGRYEDRSNQSREVIVYRMCRQADVDHLKGINQTKQIGSVEKKPPRREELQEI